MHTLPQLNRGDFKAMVEQHAMVIIDFWADDCEPCVRFKPVFEQVASEYPHIAFGMVNTDDAGEIARYFDVKQIPCLLVIKQRIVIDAVYGEMKQHELEHHIQMWAAFDITEINEHFHQKQMV